MPSTWDAVKSKVPSDYYAMRWLSRVYKMEPRGGLYTVTRPLSPYAWLCLQYLCEEWDYDYKLAPGFKGQVSWYYEISKQSE